MSIIKKLRRDVKGATAIEYGLIAALVAVAAAGTLQTVGKSVDGTFTSANTKLESAGK